MAARAALVDYVCSKTQPEDEEWEEVEPKATMIKLNGKRWQCKCGANVQTKYAVKKDGTVERYRCNGCGTCFEGE